MSNTGVLFVEVNVTLQKARRHFVLLLFMDNNSRKHPIPTASCLLFLVLFWEYTRWYICEHRHTVWLHHTNFCGVSHRPSRSNSQYRNSPLTETCRDARTSDISVETRQGYVHPSAHKHTYTIMSFFSLHPHRASVLTLTHTLIHTHT